MILRDATVSITSSKTPKEDIYKQIRGVANIWLGVGESDESRGVIRHFIETDSDLMKRFIRDGDFNVFEHCSISALFILDRASGAALVRERVAYYAQESQRYCVHEPHVEFIIPRVMRSYLSEGIYTCESSSELPTDLQATIFFNHLLSTEVAYTSLLKSSARKGCASNGVDLEDARMVLPNAVATRVLMTANLREWLHIFQLFNSPSAPLELYHLMRDLHKEFKDYLPEIFDEPKEEEEEEEASYADASSFSDELDEDFKLDYCIGYDIDYPSSIGFGGGWG